MRYMKRIIQSIIPCMLAAAIFLAGATAAARAYAGDGFSIEVPDGSNVYYYTPSDTNMKDDMLKSAQSEPDVGLLTGVYIKDAADGLLKLAYSLKVASQPLEAGEEGAEARTAHLEELMAQMSDGYTFGDITQEELAGEEAGAVTGDSTAEAYSARIYTVAKDGTLYTVTLIYKQAGDDQYLNGALSQLRTLELGTQAGAPVTAVPTSAPQSTITPTPSPATASVSPDKATATPSAAGAVPLTPIEREDTPGVVAFLQENALLVCIGAGAVALAVAIAILVVRVKRQKKRNEALKEAQGIVPDAVPRSKAIPWGEIHIAAREMEKPGEQQEEEEPAKQPEDGLWTMRVVEGALRQAYSLKGKKDYIYAARQFNDVVKHTNEIEVKKAAEMQVIKCLISAKQAEAALKKAQQALKKDYGYTVDERVKLKSIIQILRKQTGGNEK
ncbi:hypothetical protein [Christensenella timonensis]|uniref:hypothetical protein n=1 Tax=Christensenella timonensis TaxID=1816678 RepID=UPI00082B0849|nr:hypothetical protein [Christensenella timonensis]